MYVWLWNTQKSNQNNLYSSRLFFFSLDRLCSFGAAQTGMVDVITYGHFPSISFSLLFFVCEDIKARMQPNVHIKIHNELE